MATPLPANQITLFEITGLSGVSRFKASTVARLGLFGFPVQQGVLGNRQKVWDRNKVLAWLKNHDLKTLVIYKDKPEPVIAMPDIRPSISFKDIFSGKYATPEEQQEYLSKKIKARNSKRMTTLSTTGYKQ